MNFSKCAIHSNPSNGAVGQRVDVTDAGGQVLAAVSDGQTTTQARFVEVANNGPDTVYIRVGGTAVAGEGIPIYEGGMYSSPTPITAKITAICSAGETAVVEVTPYNQI